MAKLKFKGPFHWKHIDNVNNQLKKVLENSYGIYIWGFMFNISDGKISDLVDFSNSNNIPKIDECLNKGKPFGYKNEKWIFIPYYIGRAIFNKKGSLTLYDRIKNHHSVTSSAGLKYTRLAMSYYKQFYNDVDFPIPNGQSNWLINLPLSKRNTQYLNYFNNEQLLNDLYKPQKAVGNKNSWPINNQKFILEDTLEQIINSCCKNPVNCNTNKKHFNNFWFCYMDISTKEDGCSKDWQIIKAEPQTFYALKGKTVSQTEEFSKNHIAIDLFTPTNTCKYIFKHTCENKIVQNPRFRGYKF